MQAHVLYINDNHHFYQNIAFTSNFKHVPPVFLKGVKREIDCYFNTLILFSLNLAFLYSFQNSFTNLYKISDSDNLNYLARKVLFSFSFSVNDVLNWCNKSNWNVNKKVFSQQWKINQYLVNKVYLLVSKSFSPNLV